MGLKPKAQPHMGFIIIEMANVLLSDGCATVTAHSLLKNSRLSFDAMSKCISTHTCAVLLECLNLAGVKSKPKQHERMYSEQIYILYV